MKKEHYKFGSILIKGIDCKNNCVFCDMKNKENKNFSLSKKGELKLLEDTKNIIKKGLNVVDISGNSPLEYDKIINYLKWIRPKFERIIVLDPGLRLSEKDFAKDLAKTGIDTIIIPIYGSTPKVHDLCVGNEGAFEKITTGIQKFIKYKNQNQKVGLSSIIFQQNKEDIVNLPNFIKDNFGLHNLKINLFLVALEDYKKFEDVYVPFKEVKEIIKKLSKVENFFIDFEYYPPCIFTKNELENFSKKGNFKFFNAHYSYNLSHRKENNKIKKFVAEYRKQEHHSKCTECFLKEKGLCSGVMSSYLTLNKDFNYNPISKKTYQKIKNILSHKEVN